MLIAYVLIASLAAILGIPVFWFCLQIIFACISPKKQEQSINTRPGKVTVLVPAHNESINLIPTLRALRSQACSFLQVLVIADNCTDDTAEVARREGVEVIERDDPHLRGKGYALDFGIQHLKAQPPDLVLVLDADCLPEESALENLACLAWNRQKPMQALYVMKNQPGSSSKKKIAEFAWLVKNHVRPRGLNRLGMGCQLTGSGMAFPWEILQQVSLANGSIVEDMKLGIALAERGHAPEFSEFTVVTSFFPNNEEGTQSQRTRWEHGHLAMLLTEGIPKTLEGLRNRNWQLCALALDLCIPPLALLVTCLLAFGAVAAVYWAWSGDYSLFLIGLIYLLTTGSCVTMAWWRFGRHLISAQQLLMVPLYLIAKLPVYGNFLWRRQANWVRSKRDQDVK